MMCDHLLQAAVQPLAVLVQHHRVSVAVQLLKRQARVVLLLDLLDRVLQQRPDCVHVLLVHVDLWAETETQNML